MSTRRKLLKGFGKNLLRNSAKLGRETVNTVKTLTKAGSVIRTGLDKSVPIVQKFSGEVFNSALRMRNSVDKNLSKIRRIKLKNK